MWINSSVAQSGHGGLIHNSGRVYLEGSYDGGGGGHGWLQLAKGQTAKNGGAIYNDGDLELMCSTDVGGSEALAGAGGGLSNDTGGSTRSNATFDGNSAVVGGGVASLGSFTTVSYPGGNPEIKNGTATLAGGLLAGAPTVLTDVRIDGDAATNAAGVLVSGTNHGTEFYGHVEISNNTASENGGGLTVEDGNVRKRPDATSGDDMLFIHDNLAYTGASTEGHGGGMWITGSGDVTVSNLVMDSNEAEGSAAPCTSTAARCSSSPQRFRVPRLTPRARFMRPRLASVQLINSTFTDSSSPGYAFEVTDEANAYLSFTTFSGSDDGRVHRPRTRRYIQHRGLSVRAQR